MRKVKACRVTFYILLMVVVAGESNDMHAQQTSENAAWREMNNRAREVIPVMREAARLYDVDPRALWTIAYLETKFRPELISPKGARGMMQFMPATAARFELHNPHDTTAAIHAAARYVRQLSNRFGNRLELVLAGYNAGEGAVDAYLRGVALRTSDGRIINPKRSSTRGIPPYKETRNYVARGLQVMNAVVSSNVFTSTDLAATRPLLVPSIQHNYQHNYQPRHSASITDSSLSLPSTRPPAVASQIEVAPVSRYAISNLSQTLKSEDSSTADKFSRTNAPLPRSFRAGSALSAGSSPRNQRINESEETNDKGARQPPLRSMRAQQ